MNEMPDTPRRERRVNVMLSDATIASIERSGLSLSEFIEARIARELRAEANRKLCRENQDALDSYNDRIDREGLMSERYGMAKRPRS